MPTRGYWERIARAIAAFADKGDRLECTDVWRSEDPAQCELCGHTPILYLHRLKNLRTGKSLIVGNQCIVNYKRVLAKRAEPFDLAVGPKLRWWADRMNAGQPGLVKIVADSQNGTFDDLAVLEEAHSMNASMDAARSESDLADLEDTYDEDDEDLTEDADYDPDEEAPEGLGRDEVDWDSL